MSFPVLSLAPDIRNLPVFYHFGYARGGSSQPERRGFTRQESLTMALQRIFETEFPGIIGDFRNAVIKIIVEELDVEHKNLVMLCAATSAIYNMRLYSQQLTPESFAGYFDFFSKVIVKDIQGKTTEVDIQLLTTKFKATFYRYLIYVQTNSRDFNRRIENTNPNTQ